MAVVREDVVKMGFDVDTDALKKLTGMLDEIRGILTGSIGGDAFDDLTRESRQATRAVNNVRDSINGITPEGLNETVERLDETEEGSEDARRALNKLGKLRFDKTVSSLKSIVNTLGRVGVAAGKMLAKGIATGVAGVGTMVVKSVTNYADYEQLVGGVETLFGDSAGTVQMYADGAYATAGLSANAYMETVTGFAASLVQSLGGNTGAAAFLANMAITDMADNANKMGTDMEAIQNAYQGFAKENYTMLDNLKLGYGGTKGEMERLLQDAEKLTGIKYNISSFADIIRAINVIQGSLGITGTTADEAATTISGSLSTLKAAWSNTLTSLILGGYDFDTCLGNLIASAKTFANNIIPALLRSLNGVGKLIEAIAPIIEAELPTLVSTLLPSLIKAATALVKGVIVALPDIARVLVAELPDVLTQVWEGIAEAFGDIPGLDRVEGFFSGLKKLIVDNTALIQGLIPAVLGLVAVLKVFNKIKGITSLFGGRSGSSGDGFFAGLAKLKPQAVLKGILNMTIILGGLTALAAAVMAVAPSMAQLCDLGTMGQIVIAIGATGLVGAAMAGLAGVVGKIPATTVVTGLADIALALGGFTAVAAAFGALTQVDGFTALIQNGGQTLTDICAAIGEMAGALVGSVIGGIGEGVTASLPDIGTNLSDFATNIQPMFTTLGSVDTEGLSAFALAFAAFIAAIAGEQLVGIITGGIDYEGLGTKLNGMATGLSGFFTTILTFPEGCFEKAGELFTCLAGIKALPEEGGVVGWFTGKVDYAKMATGLQQLAGAAGAFTTIQTIPDAAFSAMTGLFNCLAGIKSLPTDGGVKGWFTGEINYWKIANGVQQLASTAFIAALTAISALPETAFSGLQNLFDTLAGIQAVPNQGGVLEWFSGNAYSGLTAVANQLPGLGSSINSFFTNTGNRTDFEPIKTLFNTLGEIKLDSDAISKGFLGLGASKMESMGRGLTDFATKAATFFSSINGLNLENLQGFFTQLGSAGDLPEALETINGTVGDALSKLVTTASEKLTALRTEFSDRLGEIVTLMSVTATAMQSSGASIMDGVNLGMESRRGMLIATAQSIAQAIQSAFNVELAIHSPSRKTYQSGVYVGEGYDLGMQSKIPDLQDTASRMGTAAIPYASHYSPDTEGDSVTSNHTSSETTTIAPAFNLTITGTQDDRATARKVKQWVTEAMQDVFDSLNRKSTVIREV